MRAGWPADVSARARANVRPAARYLLLGYGRKTRAGPEESAPAPANLNASAFV
jgi:hypothetical protein